MGLNVEQKKPLQNLTYLRYVFKLLIVFKVNGGKIGNKILLNPFDQIFSLSRTAIFLRHFNKLKKFRQKSQLVLQIFCNKKGLSSETKNALLIGAHGQIFKADFNHTVYSLHLGSTGGPRNLAEKKIYLESLLMY
jgi:hypothetical protein